MKLSVVILNWNALEDTAACVRAVQGWEATGVVERPTIWVVDNGSRPPGVEPLCLEYPDVNVIRSPANRGFAGGNNLGIEAALASGADAVLLLNNDAALDARSVAAICETPGSNGYACWLVRAGLTAGQALWRRARAAALGGLDGVRGRFSGQNQRVLS